MIHRICFRISPSKPFFSKKIQGALPLPRYFAKYTIEIILTFFQKKIFQKRPSSHVWSKKKQNIQTVLLDGWILFCLKSTKARHSSLDFYHDGWIIFCIKSTKARHSCLDFYHTQNVFKLK
jgi:hypothetical protein